MIRQVRTFSLPSEKQDRQNSAKVKKTRDFIGILVMIEVLYQRKREYHYLFFALTGLGAGLSLMVKILGNLPPVLVIKPRCLLVASNHQDFLITGWNLLSLFG